MQLTVLVDNNTFIDQYYLSEPAAAYYIEDGDSRILWDCGYSDIILRNAQALGIDLGRLTDIAISHGHDDHTRGLRALTAAYDLSNMRLTAHPLAFDPKRTADGQLIGSPYTASELAQRCQLRLSAEPIKLSPRITFLGEIPRTFPFEAAAPIGQRQSAESWIADWLADDTALVYESPAGLYIITACSHSGICNICQYAQTVTGQTRILGIIGGFHLFGVTPQLTATIDYFKTLGITDLYPCHCVDFPARAAIHEQLPLIEVGVGLTLEW